MFLYKIGHELWDFVIIHKSAMQDLLIEQVSNRELEIKHVTPKEFKIPKYERRVWIQHR